MLSYFFQMTSQNPIKALAVRSTRKRPSPNIITPPTKVFITEAEKPSKLSFNLDIPADEVEKLPLEDLQRNILENQGRFTAHTGTHFTNARITHEKGLNEKGQTAASENNEKQIRIKLPEKTICAFVAVGCRYGRLESLAGFQTHFDG